MLGVICNSKKLLLKKPKYWRRSGHFSSLAEVKVSLLSDSRFTCMKSTVTNFAGINNHAARSTFVSCLIL